MTRAEKKCGPNRLLTVIGKAQRPHNSVNPALCHQPQKALNRCFCASVFSSRTPPPSSGLPSRWIDHTMQLQRSTACHWQRVSLRPGSLPRAVTPLPQRSSSRSSALLVRAEKVRARCRVVLSWMPRSLVSPRSFVPCVLSTTSWHHGHGRLLLANHTTPAALQPMHAAILCC